VVVTAPARRRTPPAPPPPAPSRPASAAPRLAYSAPLDGLRAVAVLCVLFAHVGVPYFYGGGAGVFVFYTLSGFLITSLLLQEALGSGRVSLRGFYARRLRRLQPALLVLVAVVTGLALVGSFGPLSDTALRTTPAVLLSVTNWVRAGHGDAGPYHHTWSLGVEEQFYLCWSLVMAGLAVLLRGRRLAWGVLAVTAAVALGALLLRLQLWTDASSLDRVYNGLDTEADQLAVGCCLAAALVLAGPRVRARIGAWTARLVLPCAAALVCVVVFLPEPQEPAMGDFLTWGLTLVALSSGVLVADAVLRPAGPLGRLLRLAPLVLLGRLSYSLYLWHFPVVMWLRAQGLDAGRLVAVGIPLSLALAALSYRYVEQPFRRRRTPR